MIAGITPISNEKTWRMCVPILRKQVEHLIIRLDAKFNIDVDEVIEICEPDLVYTSDLVWDAWNWREELLRKLDTVKPDIVLFPDDDEYFDNNIVSELTEFRKSNKKVLTCREFLMKTIDDRQNVPTYPTAPHMVGFKWSEGLTYAPYCGYGQLANYGWREEYKWYIKSKYYHLAFWTQEMQDEKIEYAMKRFGQL